MLGSGLHPSPHSSLCAVNLVRVPALVPRRQEGVLLGTVHLHVERGVESPHWVSRQVIRQDESGGRQTGDSLFFDGQPKHRCYHSAVPPMKQPFHYYQTRTSKTPNP